jgi:type II secretory pathway pseudopilin PulG
MRIMKQPFLARSEPRRGLTLIEFMMIVGLLVILAAIAIPNFIDFRKDARNSATQAAVGALRSAVVIAAASIQLKEDPSQSSPKFPTFQEMEANSFLDAHPVLKGTPILDTPGGIPKNPWSQSTFPASSFNRILNCPGPKGALHPTEKNQGWCYLESTGEIWANSNLNGDTATENTY